MWVGVLINLICTYYCGKWAVLNFKHRANFAGWMCLIASSYNLALVLKYLAEAL